MQCSDWVRSGSCAPPQIAEMLSHTDHKDEQRGRGSPAIKICSTIENKGEGMMGRKDKRSVLSQTDVVMVAIIMTNMYGVLTSMRFHSKHFTSIRALLVTVLWIGHILNLHVTDEEAQRG